MLRDSAIQIDQEIGQFGVSACAPTCTPAANVISFRAPLCPSSLLSGRRILHGPRFAEQDSNACQAAFDRMFRSLKVGGDHRHIFSGLNQLPQLIVVLRRPRSARVWQPEHFTTSQDTAQSGS
jgi:hypothetical protein